MLRLLKYIVGKLLAIVQMAKILKIVEILKRARERVLSPYDFEWKTKRQE